MDIANIIKEHNLRPTSNRILVADALARSPRPLSLSDLDMEIATMYKATIFRVLEAFVQADVVHTIDDGTGSVKYELCHGSHDNHDDDDRHVHFHCLGCGRTVCFEQTPIPEVDLPDGYERYSVNYVVKGLCPTCSQRPTRSV